MGQFTLLEGMARGGMAELFLAQRDGAVGYERLVVVKRILPSMAGDPEFTRMFIDEAELLRRIEHPNIVRIFDSGVAAGNQHYFAMEYIHGKDVRSILRICQRRREAIPLAHVVTIGLALCDGLSAAHDAAIIHRDVSPPNILVSYHGATKLVDFGVARIAERTNITKIGTRKGKILYMSPEQAIGERIDRRADIFAVGAVLYELLTLQSPFAAETEYAVVDKILRGSVHPPSVSAMGPVPRKLDQIVLRALKREREQRFPTADAFKEALQAFAQHERIQPSVARLGAWLRKIAPPPPHPITRLREQPNFEEDRTRVGPIAMPNTPLEATAIEAVNAAQSASEMAWDEPPTQIYSRHNPGALSSVDTTPRPEFQAGDLDSTTAPMPAVSDVDLANVPVTQTVKTQVPAVVIPSQPGYSPQQGHYPHPLPPGSSASQWARPKKQTDWLLTIVLILTITTLIAALWAIVYKTRQARESDAQGER